MDLEARFPALANFLGAYFPDAAAEGRRTDTAIVAFFLETTLPEDLATTRTELGRLLEEDPLPRAELARLSTRRLDDEAAARAWLTRLQELLIAAP